jgi:hypothetical protein
MTVRQISPESGPTAVLRREAVGGEWKQNPDLGYSPRPPRRQFEEDPERWDGMS